MSIGRFIIECDMENFAIAGSAAEYMLAHPEHKDVVSTYGQGADQITMFSKRLKRGIRVQQVKP